MTDSEREKAARLARFRGQLEADDRRTVEYWKRASAAEHAAAMAELSNYAVTMARQTGHVRRADEPMPNLTAIARDWADARDLVDGR